MKNIVRWFDKLEDHIRARLSHYPIIYALIGGVGVVLFWKGVWETAELTPYLFGPASILLGVIVMLTTGLLVSFFIGDNIILSGIAREKKLVEKTEEEVLEEHATLADVIEALEHMNKKMEQFARKHNHEKTR